MKRSCLVDFSYGKKRGVLSSFEMLVDVGFGVILNFVICELL